MGPHQSDRLEGVGTHLTTEDPGNSAFSGVLAVDLPRFQARVFDTPVDSPAVSPHEDAVPTHLLVVGSCKLTAPPLGWFSRT